MALLIGTVDGVYGVDSAPFERADVTCVLDCGPVHDLRQFAGADGTFVAADGGMYRSIDGGETWEDLELPGGDVWSVLATADGTLFAGTNDPALYRSFDDGATWHELRSFRRLPSQGVWESPVDPHRARVRALESPPDCPEQVVVGVESGGFHISEDSGETWTDRRDRGPDDFHRVLALSKDVYVATTGYLDLDFEHLDFGHAFGIGGLYRTADAGRSWSKQDVGNDHAYARTLFVQDGILLFSGATEPPGDWRRRGADAALFEAEGLGRTYERVDYPGAPHEVVEAFAELDGGAICGTASFPPGEERSDGGRIIQRTGPGEYETVGRVPANVSALVCV